MRFVRFTADGAVCVGIEDDQGFRGLPANGAAGVGDLDHLLRLSAEEREAVAASLAAGKRYRPDDVSLLPPLREPGKIICVGLNYVDHSLEAGFEPPAYPTIFTRFTTTLVGGDGAILAPACSEQLDYEGEIAAVIGREGKAIPLERALDHVFGYALFNDVSVRDYQFKSPQWTMGKNFDGTGPFGPALVTADELPPGCRGLNLVTRLNGTVVQSASTDDMIFDIASLICILSEVMTLLPGDVIVTGTPAGVGLGRKPPLWMKPGDVCEISVDGLGTLRNTVALADATHD